MPDDTAGETPIRAPTAPPAPVTRTSVALDTADHPAAAYLASLDSESSRRSMLWALDTAARALGAPDARRTPWERLRRHHMTALRDWAAGRYKATTVNRILAALKGVVRTARRLGMVDAETCRRTIDVRPVKFITAPAGRVLDRGEITALFEACANDGGPAGPRDAALFALMLGCGLRRHEATSRRKEDYDPADKTLKVSGKGRRERLVPVSTSVAGVIRAWLDVRGDHPGPLLHPVNKGGRIVPGPMSAPAVRWRLKKRADEAGVRQCTASDLRRTFVATLLSRKERGTSGS